jgi:hypothetical protein
MGKRPRIIRQTLSEPELVYTRNKARPVTGDFPFKADTKNLGAILSYAISSNVVSLYSLISKNRLLLLPIMYNAMTGKCNSTQSLANKEKETFFRRLSKYGLATHFSVHPEARKLIKEKCGKERKELVYHYFYVLHHIFIYPFVNRKYERFGAVPIHFETLRNVLGKETSTILSDLKEWGIISRDNVYFKNEKSYHYKICEPYVKGVTNEVCRNFTLSRKILQTRELLSRNEDPTVKSIQLNIQKVKINKNAAFAAISRMTFDKPKKKCKDVEKARAATRCLVLNIENEILYAKQDGFSGRIHTNLTVLPRQLRKYITVDDEELYQVDMVSSQPMMLHRLMERMGIRNEEVDSYKKLIESKRFYEHFADCFSEDKDRTQLKIALLIQLFFDKPRKHYFKSKKKFDSLFPFISSFVARCRRPDYKNMPLLLQREEVNFMQNGVIPEFMKRYPDTFFTTIHDSIVVKKSDINKALEVMQWKYDLEGYNVKVEAKPF